ncbi:hypothetical protein V6N13_059608 [Hibiscus sabdariffa]|uniref:Uncharacterized protein n=1 Tax=Hibiscus sabdariffa TaxID=183260 RepID=A0ABR2GCJ1_9ROSI
MKRNLLVSVVEDCSEQDVASSEHSSIYADLAHKRLSTKDCVTSMRIEYVDNNQGKPCWHDNSMFSSDGHTLVLDEVVGLVNWAMKAPRGEMAVVVGELRDVEG